MHPLKNMAQRDTTTIPAFGFDTTAVMSAFLSQGRSQTPQESIQWRQWVIDELNKTGLNMGNSELEEQRKKVPRLTAAQHDSQKKKYQPRDGRLSLRKMLHLPLS